MDIELDTDPFIAIGGALERANHVRRGPAARAKGASSANEPPWTSPLPGCGNSPLVGTGRT